jgi:hypothetical protein
VPFKTLKKGSDFFADREMNLFSEANRPVNFCTPFLVEGGCILLIASIFIGFASMPPLCDHASQKFSPSYAEDTLFLVKFETVLTKVGEGFPMVLNVVFAFLASHDDIVDVSGNIYVQLGVKHRCNGPVECATCIAKPLRHSYISVSAEGSGKTAFLLI